MKTRQLYYENPYGHTFDAQVLKVVEDKKGYGIILDQTYFFPEGGGQAGDIGTLGECVIFDTTIEEDEICHWSKTSLKEGATILGQVNFKERFSRMQQHSGEHILSGLIHHQYGYDNVGFHLGEYYVTLDFNGELTKEDCVKIEEQANQIVFENRSIEVLCPSKEELASLEYRSKKELEGQVRIISIPQVDVCACCAPHLHTTGEIGLIKIVDVMKYKKGSRLTMLAGNRALLDYQQKEASVKGISALLSAKEEKVLEAVKRLQKEKEALQEENKSLGMIILQKEVEAISLDDKDVICLFKKPMDGTLLREFVNLLLKKGMETGAVFSGEEQTGYRFVVGSRTKDMRALATEMRNRLKAKGGGSKEMIQGQVNCSKEEIEAVIYSWYNS